MTKTLTLRSFDIPALTKFGIGFDNMFDELMRVSANNPAQTIHLMILYKSMKTST